MAGVLIIGGTGLVGNALLRAWQGKKETVYSTVFRAAAGAGFQRLDMRDAGAVKALLSQLRPELVAVPAANPYVDYCELHPEETRELNVEGTRHVAQVCREIGARMLFFSSDYVFDGAKDAYTEEDAPAPLNEYGRQKLQSERDVLSADPRNLVIRISAAYGWHRDGKNFALQVIKTLSAGQRMRVTDDVRYKPTFVENLAEVVLALAGSGAAGVFHAAGADELARAEFARRIARVFGLDASLLEPVSAREFRAPAARPARSSLRTDKLAGLVKVPLLGVDEGLRRMKAMEASWRAYAAALPAPVELGK